MFNTTIVYADEHGGSSGTIPTPTPPYYISPDKLDEYGRLKPPALLTFLDKIMTAAFAGEASTELGSLLYSFLLDYDNSDNSISIDEGGSTVHLHERFVNELNQAVQDKVHALDGYYLFEPANSDLSASIPAVQDFFMKFYKNNSYIYPYASSNSFPSALSEWYEKRKYGVVFVPTLGSNGDGFYADGISVNRPVAIPSPYLDNDTSKYMFCDGSFLGVYQPDKGSYYNGSFYTFSCETSLSYFSEGFVSGSAVIPFLKSCMGFAYGPSFKLFYSLTDLKKYLNNGKQRTYAPQLPSTTISIPIKYINNSVSLPDITYNINTTNKTEVEIQNEYNTTLNNYLNDLNNFTDGSEVTPTPTPDGGFTDGATPTPKPDFGDDSNPTDTNDWLKKIYEWLQSFGDTHSKFEKTITDYIEANDGKLDQIIEAINALSDGKTEDEKNGCKYDFTALSDFMTKLWNESDKKFDKMVELLEENNKYQKKLVNSLNEIKAILVTQTIMDVFQDRSQQTAEKAKDKFPTSLPWDIALVVNVMSAEPEKPQFDLPIQIKSLNINEEIHVDLASGEWEKLAKTCRYLLSILFILLMIQLSRKLFSNGGDD